MPSSWISATSTIQFQHQSTLTCRASCISWANGSDERFGSESTDMIREHLRLQQTVKIGQEPAIGLTVCDWTVIDQQLP